MNRVSFDARIDPLKDFRRALTVKVMASVLDRDVSQVAAKYYGGEHADMIAKAASASMDTTNTGGLAGVKVGPFLRSLRGRSAAASLFALGLDVDLRGVGSATLPAIGTDMPNAAWVPEGGPAPVYRASLANPVTLVPKKLMALAALTNELADLSADAAEQIISDLLNDSVARALDAKLFSTDAATAIAPAGILNGITATPGTAGGDQKAMVTDLRAFTAAVTTAGGGSNLVIIAAPPQAITLQLLGASLQVPVITAPYLANGTVIVMDAGAFASGFGADPRIEVSQNALVHMEDTIPAHIGTFGTPNVLAAPARSAFQADLKVLRCILRAAFAMRAPAIAFTNTATW